MSIAVEIGGIFSEGLQETVTYTDAVPATTSLTAIVVPLGQRLGISDTWETDATRSNVYVDSSAVSAITLTKGTDTITLANGDVLTVMERDIETAGIYRYLCEKEDVDAIALRARRY